MSPRSSTMAYWTDALTTAIEREDVLWKRLDACIEAETAAKDNDDAHAIEVIQRRLLRTRAQYNEALKWRNLVLPIHRGLAHALKWSVAEDLQLQRAS